MRPLRMRLKGFTAFREEQVVDFEPLTVFSVTGPTGSGKTSLLDALTYALYGEVERVGLQCAQLVSQGLPRLSVELDFQVGAERFRIARSTAAGGQTKVLLQRLIDGDPHGFGEGADRVRECRAIVEKLVGLDYTELTRSVLLPQGRFAEFLAGKPDERRRILTDLLGLSLFRRMAELAGQLSRDARSEAAGRRSLIETEYSGVTTQARDAAQARALAARKREVDLMQAKKRVDAIAEEWREVERLAADLRACMDEAVQLAQVAASAGTSLQSLARQGAAVASRRADRERSAVELRRTAAAATQMREEKERLWGRPADLQALLARADALGDLRAELEETHRALRKLEIAKNRLSESVKRREAAAKSAKENLLSAQAALTSAESAHEAAQHTDLVSAVSVGLSRGEPCPVCGVPLARTPRSQAPKLAEARASLESARKARDRAAALREQRNLELTEAKRDLTDAMREIARLSTEAERSARTIQMSERAIVAAVRGAPPAEALATLRKRVQELKRAAEQERGAERAAIEAERRALQAEQERLQVVQKISEVRSKLPDPAALLRRVGQHGDADWTVPDMPSPPADIEDAASLATFAGDRARFLRTVAESLGTMMQKRVSTQPTLLAQAQAALSGLVPVAPSLGELIESIDRAIRHAVAEATRSGDEVERMTAQLIRLEQLVMEVHSLTQRADIFGALAADLRAPNVIAFLQEEAMRALAASGSTHLMRLSDERYRLSARDEEFHVIDGWNADEERSVRTLSGGETFLASLALALALADQVRSLAVSQRARLDSLFLDEGVGTLDSESLRTVVEAIHQLGESGRLIGVVTHVREVAEQFDCIQVEKSAHGSRVTMTEAAEREPEAVAALLS